jgi:hypothetical protein
MRAVRPQTMTAPTTVSWRTRAGSLVVLLALAAGAASCGSATTGDAGSRGASTRPAPTRAHRMLAHLTAMQRAHFALLRTRPEGLPPHVRDLVHPRGAGVNPALAQRIPVLVPGSYWLLPGIGQLCVVSQVPWLAGAGTICGSTRQALAEGIATVAFMPAGRAAAGAPTRLVVGVAPDGVRAALVHTHGAVAAVPVVRGGAFALRDAQRATSDFIELRAGR